MAKEYKFMFDRRFDDPDETDSGTQEDLSSVSVDGIPSISQLLDTITTQVQDITTKEAEPDKQEINEESASSENEATDSLPDEPEENPPPADSNSALNTPPPVQTEKVQIQVQESPINNLKYTAEEMEDARNKALEEGLQRGLEEGRKSAWQEAMASIEKQNSDTLITIDASIKGANRFYNRH